MLRYTSPNLPDPTHLPRWKSLIFSCGFIYSSIWKD